MRMGGEVIGSRRVSERAVRYFYGEQKRLKTFDKAQRPKPTREIVFDALTLAGPAGLSGADIKAMCSSIHSAKNACEELRHAERMFGCRWPGADSWRYFLTKEWMDEAYAAARKAFVPRVSERPEREPKPAKKATPKPHQYIKLKPSPKPKRVGPQGEATNPRGVKPIECRPTMAGQRWGELRPEPIFSRLGIGRYVE